MREVLVPVRTRVTGLLLAVVALGVALVAACSGGGASPSGTSPSGTSPSGTSAGARAGGDGEYLALGDSIPFGYDPGLPLGGPASRYVGYPELAAPRLGLRLTNLSCPGETTGSFADLTAPDNGCSRFRYAASLHVPYDGSQLAAALAFLASHPGTRLVTLTIGANDVALCARTSAAGCRGQEETAALAAVSSGVGRILDAVRSRYRGTLAVVTYYASRTDPAWVAGERSLDGVLARQAAQRSAIVVDGFTAFRNAAASTGGDPCVGHLLLTAPGGGCDVHPSPAGAKLLADALVSAARPRLTAAPAS